MNILDFDNPYWNDHFSSSLVRELMGLSRALGKHSANNVKKNGSTTDCKEGKYGSGMTEKTPGDTGVYNNWRDKLFDAEHRYSDNYNVSAIRDADNAVTNYKIYVVYAPYKKSDVEVQVESDRIVMNIGMRETKEDEDSLEEIVFTGYTRRPFNLSIPFEDIVRDKNEEVDADHISARTDDGVLEITVPIIRKAVSRKIPLA